MNAHALLVQTEKNTTCTNYEHLWARGRASGGLDGQLKSRREIKNHGKAWKRAASYGELGVHRSQRTE